MPALIFYSLMISSLNVCIYIKDDSSIHEADNRRAQSPNEWLPILAHSILYAKMCLLLTVWMTSNNKLEWMKMTLFYPISRYWSLTWERIVWNNYNRIDRFSEHWTLLKWIYFVFSLRNNELHSNIAKWCYGGDLIIKKNIFGNCF